MSASPILQLKKLGQSIWLDYIERRILEDGTLKNFIDQDGVAGMTSNPAIFEKAISHTDEYDAAIREMSRRDASRDEIYEKLVIYDVKKAADIFSTVYAESAGTDGYVSLEVSPLLAHDTQRSIDEGRRLWRLLERPNVMIKIPGTRAGLPAIRQLLSEGINVNVTLLFSVDRYLEVLEQYMGALEDRIGRGEPVDQIASVASFFLSRIDNKVDPLLDKVAESASPRKAEAAGALRGQAAIASAGLAYARYREHCNTDRWRKLSNSGARTQRLLWASTSTKDERYSDIKYIEALIWPETVNTVPLNTLSAYRHHGKPGQQASPLRTDAESVLDRLADLDIDLAEIHRQLEQEGVKKFVDPFEALLDTLSKQRD